MRLNKQSQIDFICCDVQRDLGILAKLIKQTPNFDASLLEDTLRKIKLFEHEVAND